MKHRPAHFTGKYQGKRVHAFHVTAQISDLTGTAYILDAEVLAPSAADAMWHIRGEAFDAMYALGLWQPIEILTHGPRGGNYMGWDTLMAEGFAWIRRSNNGQPEFDYRCLE